MTVALTEQTKRIQLIDRVDNTFAKINIIQNDIHDFLSLPPTPHLNAVPIAENWRKISKAPTLLAGLGISKEELTTYVNGYVNLKACTPL